MTPARSQLHAAASPGWADETWFLVPEGGVEPDDASTAANHHTAASAHETKRATHSPVSVAVSTQSVREVGRDAADRRFDTGASPHLTRRSTIADFVQVDRCSDAISASDGPLVPVHVPVPAELPSLLAEMGDASEAEALVERDRRVVGKADPRERPMDVLVLQDVEQHRYSAFPTPRPTNAGLMYTLVSTLVSYAGRGRYRPLLANRSPDRRSRRAPR